MDNFDVGTFIANWSTIGLSGCPAEVEELAARFYAPTVDYKCEPFISQLEPTRAEIVIGGDAFRIGRPVRRKITRTITQGDRIFVEAVLLLNSDTETRVVPECVWWGLGDDGRIREEKVYWALPSSIQEFAGIRSIPNARDPVPFDLEWYSSFVDHYAALWTTDPAGRMLDEIFVSDCFAEVVGQKQVHGRQDLAAVLRGSVALFPPPERKMRILDHIAQNGVVAAETSPRGARYGQGPVQELGGSTVVFTLTSDGKVARDRAYSPHYALRNPSAAGGMGSA